MSDTNWQPPQPGDPGTPRDVNRESDIVWDGNKPEKYAGQNQESKTSDSEKSSTPKKATKSA